MARSGPPSSVGIIPDGNRRWAVANGVPLRAAYARGAMVARRAVEYLLERGVSRIFIYVLSADNCTRRSGPEVDAVSWAVAWGLMRALEWAEERGVRLLALGDRSLMPPQVARVVEDLIWDGGEPSRPFVALAVCYSPEWEERTHGCSATARALGEIDLVFRSGGERRLSGFFPRLTVYSELYFTDKLWPDVTEADFEQAIRWYMGRDRRRGA